MDETNPIFHTLGTLIGYRDSGRLQIHRSVTVVSKIFTSFRHTVGLPCDLLLQRAATPLGQGENRRSEIDFLGSTGPNRDFSLFLDDFNGTLHIWLRLW